MTIGLTMSPKIKPKLIHNLLSGLRISALKIVIKKKIIEINPKA